MANTMIVAVMIGLVVLYILTFWYGIRTLLIMARQSIWLALLGFLFAPLAQIIYYFSNKNRLNMVDKQVFYRYGLAMALTLVLSVIGALMFTAMPIN